MIWGFVGTMWVPTRRSSSCRSFRKKLLTEEKLKARCVIYEILHIKVIPLDLRFHDQTKEKLESGISSLPNQNLQNKMLRPIEE